MNRLAMQHLVSTQLCFQNVLRLRDRHAGDDPAAIHKNLSQTIDDLLHKPHTLGLEPEEAKHIAYAVAALADEIALKATAPVAQFWSSRTLQLLHFNEMTAGDGFFERLQALRQQGCSNQAVQAYYLALVLGFEGRYALDPNDRGGNHELRELVAALRQTICSADSQTLPLSPRTQQIAAPVAKSRRAFWALPLAIAAGTLIAILAINFYMASGIAAVQRSVDCLLHGEPHGG